MWYAHYTLVNTQGNLRKEHGQAVAGATLDALVFWSKLGA